MTLSEFIVKMQNLEAAGHGDLQVSIADWNEMYAQPSISATNDFCIDEIRYWNEKKQNYANVKSVILGVK